MQYQLYLKWVAGTQGVPIYEEGAGVEGTGTQLNQQAAERGLYLSKQTCFWKPYSECSKSEW